MPKRKSNEDPVASRKKTKLDQPHDTLESQKCEVHATPSPPPPSRRLRKRKTAEDSQLGQLGEPEAKRIRTDDESSELARCSRDSTPVPWPGIEEREPDPSVQAFYESCWETVGLLGDDESSELARCSRNSTPVPWPGIEEREPEAAAEEEEEPDPLVLEFYGSYLEAVGLLGDGDDDDEPQTMNRNPLPSPDPSDGNASESDTGGYAAMVASNILEQYLAARYQDRPSPVLQEAAPSSTNSSPRRRTRVSRQQDRKRSAAPSRGEQSRQQMRKKKNNRQHKSQDEKLSPAVESFLCSKRSSRRMSTGELWCLGDNNMACVVTR